MNFVWVLFKPPPWLSLKQWFSTRVASLFGIKHPFHSDLISDILCNRYLHYKSKQYQNHSYEVATKSFHGWGSPQHEELY